MKITYLIGSLIVNVLLFSPTIYLESYLKVLLVYLLNQLCLHFNVDCAHVLCLRPDCNNPITLPGQCCPECPSTSPTIEPPSKYTQHNE